LSRCVDRVRIELHHSRWSGTGIITLDLSELISADSVGFDVLERLRRDGAELRDVPAYIQLKLDVVAKHAQRRNR
jgi:hypothetical protein